MCMKVKELIFNPFLANGPILYPLETPQNQRFSGVFRGYKVGTLTGSGLMNFISFSCDLILILDVWGEANLNFIDMIILNTIFSKL